MSNCAAVVALMIFGGALEIAGELVAELEPRVPNGRPDRRQAAREDLFARLVAARRDHHPRHPPSVAPESRELAHQRESRIRSGYVEGS